MLLPAFFLLLAYLVASLPTGLMLGAIIADTDPREAGSHNIGATNVYRLLGRRLGLLTFAGDVLKGAVPVALAPTVLDVPWFSGAVAIAAFSGHCWSAFLDFRGGKGVATAAGVLLVLVPMVLVACLTVWAVLVKLTRKSSLGSLAAAVLMPTLVHLLRPEMLWASAVLTVGVIWRHRSNITRLLSGTERQTRQP
ncbi:MAG: glycerol-3-phosphate 1-O-acyltransferase PlsY [Myxococcota bacterium]|nr:glycerol-3-phosphate 1-O-acyltransferase PlsY [Myxococcota bacterium]